MKKNTTIVTTYDLIEYATTKLYGNSHTTEQWNDTCNLLDIDFQALGESGSHDYDLDNIEDYYDPGTPLYNTITNYMKDNKLKQFTLINE